MKKINKCRCCGGKKLKLYLDLGNQPLANSYHKGEKLKKYPLKVMVCRNCFHSQLSVVINPETMFKNYLYVSGTTQSFRNHTKDLAKDAVKRVKNKHPKVLDIACNDGTQLEYFRDLGCEVFGVDPAENLRPITRKKKVPVIVDYWSDKIAKKYKGEFDIITATNVFAHVNKVDLFLKDCITALKDEGVIIIEFPYAQKMISHNEFDTVYHEHLSYFLVNSFKTLANRIGLVIIDIKQTPIHGGSIRFFLGKSGIETSKVDELIKEEEKLGLNKEKTYLDFSKRVNKNKNDMKRLIQKLKLKNEKVIGYGASAKGNTMLNFFKIKLDYIVDDNQLKWGYKTPGMNIPVKSPDEIKEEKNNLNIVILSWNFFNEISKKVNIRRYKRKDNCILYVPRVIRQEFTNNSKLDVSA